MTRRARIIVNLAFLFLAIVLVLGAIAMMARIADAKGGPPPTNPVHEKECLDHNGRPTWYVEPALSAHRGHGDLACNPGDEPIDDPEDPEKPGTPSNPVASTHNLPFIVTGCVDNGAYIGLLPICGP